MGRGTRAVALGAALLALASCDSDSDIPRGPARTAPSPVHSTPTSSKSARLVPEPEVFARGLNFPVDMAWEPGTDRMFFTQKSGAIKVIVGDKILSRPCAKLPVDFMGERGALGLALDPDFSQNHRLYVYYTNADPLENRVARLTVEGNTCFDRTDIVTGIPADESGRHNGGQLEFVGDTLFVAVGDGYSDPGAAQDEGSPLGKILRVEDDGSTEVWSFGHRNPFGLAHDPATGTLYATENGPTCDDELNLIRRGRNYGWGAGYQCGTTGVGADPQGPLMRWTPNIVPTDLWFYTGPVQSLAGRLLMGDFSTGRLHSFTLSDDGRRIVDEQILYDFDVPVVDVTEGPGGALYVLTPESILRFATR